LPSPPNLRDFLLFALAPAPALAVGFAVGTRAGASTSAFLPNAIAALLGFGLALLLFKRPPGPRALRVFALVAIASLALTLAFPADDGVRRWIVVGPVRLHASSLAVPWVLAALVGGGARTGERVATVALVLIVHVLQPDAGEATAFALAAVASLFARSGLPRKARLLGTAIAIGGAAIAWTRPDRLAPVPHVERIIHLAFAMGPAASLATIVALVLLVVPFAELVRRSRSPLAIAAAVHVIASIAVTELGSFPVPVLGAGASPVLGWFVLYGLSGRSSSRAPIA